MKQIMLPSMSLLFSRALETKILKAVLSPKSSRKLQIVILPCTVQRIEKEHWHFSNCSSIQLSDLLSFFRIWKNFHPWMPVAKPCLTIKHRGCTQGFSVLMFCDVYDLSLCTNATGFNWHLLTASGFLGWMFWGFLSVTQYCQDVNPRMLIKSIMIHHLDKTHCNPRAFYEGEKQAWAEDIDIFVPTLCTSNTHP